MHVENCLLVAGTLQCPINPAKHKAVQCTMDSFPFSYLIVSHLSRGLARLAGAVACNIRAARWNTLCSMHTVCAGQRAVRAQGLDEDPGDCQAAGSLR